MSGPPILLRQWRSLEEPAFLARAAEEFPGLAAALAEPRSRRRALKLMAASFALAGLGGCDPGSSAGDIVPAVIAPANIIPGRANFYSSARIADGFATGIVVRHAMGRPIKVDGNPEHPASLGASSIHEQAMLLDFYDPDRSAGIAHDGEPVDRQRLLATLAAERARASARRGAGLRVLTGRLSSPTLSAQLDALLRQYPEARVHEWDGIARDGVRDGAVQAYGAPLELVARPERADVLLALDSDLISGAPGALAYARGFASRRNPTRTQAMSRVYAVEPTPTLIGAAADHRFVATPAELRQLLMGLAAGLLGSAPAGDVPPWLGPLVEDLRGARGRALIHLGPDHPAEAHALVHALNESLGGRGATYELLEPVLRRNPAGMSELAADMAAGQVDALIILGGNPVFAAPAAFAAALPRVRFSLSMSGSADETASAVHWFVPETHGFETWSDGRASDGTATIVQPQALPLYDGTSVHELLALLLGPTSPTPLELVRGTWRARLDDAAWRQALAAGVVPDTRSAVATVALRGPPAPLPTVAAGMQLLFRLDPNLLDGRHANNPWLQELPRPMTKLVWDNPLLVSPALARERRLVSGQVVRIAAGAAVMEAPVWIVPGQAPDTAVALLGYGRRVVGGVGRGTGFDFFPLREGGAVTIERTERHVALASTDHHDVLDVDSADIVRHVTLAELQRPGFTLAAEMSEATLYNATPRLDAQAWGMSIDLNACIGCNACVVACQAENNVPVVGKAQVLREREMHWLRIDRYYEGDAASPETYFQPMLCMHCEQAPCEVVCPVGATVHDHEGLNVMVYNRCVGTRFCSNNCPYKVRRFNYFAFTQEETRPPVSRNPDVTVRARGVMEKCTFCLQRVAEARVAADLGGRPIRDGEVRTACQAACPAQAIAFGNVADAASEVATRKRSPLDYALLEERSTRPRVTYEARVRNRNPAIVAT